MSSIYAELREEELSTKTIERNLRMLKGNLKKSKARYTLTLWKRLRDVKPEDLSWRDPLASLVLSNESDIIKELPDEDYESFMVRADKRYSK